METMQQLAADRLNACNILADSLRNAITKSGFILSPVNSFYKRLNLKDLLYKCPQDDHKRRIIWQTIDKLKKSLHFGQDPENIANYDKIPEELKWEWVNLIYKNTDRFNNSALERLIKILGNPALTIPSRERSRKALTQLKALVETMSQLEQNTNFLLSHVLNGGDNEVVSDILNTIATNSEQKKTL